MCMGGGSPPPPSIPPTPPPPPPVLEQPAPESAAKKVGEEMNNRTLGTKQYRTSLAIGTASQTNNNAGLGINA